MSKSNKHTSAITAEQWRSASEITLAVLASVGIATVAIVAPNLLQAIGSLFKQKTGRKLSRTQSERKLAQAIYYLKRSNLIQIRSNSAKGPTMQLTEKGRAKFADLARRRIVIPKASAWDKRWWLVAADIPTKTHRRGADLLRRKLRELRFYPLQRTLWLYPHNPQEALQFIVDMFGIGRFVTLMEINALDKDDELRLVNYFKEQGII